MYKLDQAWEDRDQTDRIQQEKTKKDSQQNRDLVQKTEDPDETARIEREKTQRI